MFFCAEENQAIQKIQVLNQHVDSPIKHQLIGK